MSFEMKLTLRSLNRLVKNGDVRICQKLVSPLLQLTKWLDDATDVYLLHKGFYS